MPFEQRYVGFVDILGFRELVTQATADPSAFTTLLGTLTTIATQTHSLGGQDDDFRVTSFSDCIAVSARISDTGLWAVILYCDALQFNLWPNGILFRGAITKGEMYHDDKILFGPAFNNAYELETKIATHPRIMLADDVYQDAVTSQAIAFPNYVNDYILDLQFDVPCINPFSDYKKILASYPPQGSQRLAVAKKIIQEKLLDSSGKPVLVSRWTWLARVYNDLIHQAGITGNIGIGPIQY